MSVRIVSIFFHHMKFATRKKVFLFVFLSILWRVMKCDGAARITGVRVEVGVNH